MQKNVEILNNYRELSKEKLAKVVGGKKKKTGIQKFIAGFLKASRA